MNVAVSAATPVACSLAVSFPREALSQAVNTVCKAVEGNASIENINHLRLTFAAGVLTIEGTDLDMSVSARVDAIGEALTSFDILVPAKTFKKFLDKAPKGADATLTQVDAETLEARAGRMKVTLNGAKTDEFPVMKTEGDRFAMIFNKADLSKALKRTLPAVSTEETRYYLGGVYMHVANGRTQDDPPHVVFAATDGHRLPIYRVEPLKVSSMDVFKTMAKENKAGAIIQSKAIKLIEYVLSRKGASERAIVELFRFVVPAEPAVEGENEDAEDKPPVIRHRVAITSGNIRLVVKPIDGSYPDYQRVTARQHPLGFTADREDLIEAVTAVLAMQDGKDMKVKLTTKGAEGVLMLSFDSAEFGLCEYGANAEKRGDGAVTFGLNARYLLSALKSFDPGTITFFIDCPDDGYHSNPVLILDEDANGSYTIMPMRV